MQDRQGFFIVMPHRVPVKRHVESSKTSKYCDSNERIKKTDLSCELREDERRFVDFMVVIFKVHTVELFYRQRSNWFLEICFLVSKKYKAKSLQTCDYY